MICLRENRLVSSQAVQPMRPADHVPGRVQENQDGNQARQIRDVNTHPAIAESVTHSAVPDIESRIKKSVGAADAEVAHPLLDGFWNDSQRERIRQQLAIPARTLNRRAKELQEGLDELRRVDLPMKCIVCRRSRHERFVSGVARRQISVHPYGWPEAVV